MRQGQCPYCKRAKRLLRRKGSTFEAVDVTLIRHVVKAITKDRRIE